MPTNPADSPILGTLYGSDAMRAVFDERAYFQRMLDVEAALARVQARLGIIPADAAEAITRAARVENLSTEELAASARNVGYPVVGLVAGLSRAAGEAGRWTHWGATTQDIMDTAVALQVRDALDSIDADIRELRGILVDLSKKHRDTPMAGRTHLQQALPVTFGYKTAIWLAMFDRHQQRLAQLRPRVAVVEFAGAAGTLASLGDKGFEVQKALAAELKLGVPATTWHVARDGFAETVNLLALVTGSLGKIATDIMIMASNEFGEVYEPFVKGRGASSTMPQKRNPISSELMLAAAKAVRQQAGLMVDAMIQDFERATGPWHAEWIAIPESFILTSGALHQAKFALGGLIVDTDRMKQNLGISKGLIVAEAVMMQMAPYAGRQQAHDIVYDACRTVNEKGGTLAEALAVLPDVTKHFNRDAIDGMTDPANYLGLAPQMVDRAIALSSEI